jgi:RHS repeat-associated protein
VAVGGQTTQFIYDGDGDLVKKVKPDNSKTIYVGGVYEVDKASGGSIQRTVTYYPVAGAMRINSTLYYTLKDHFGSASVVTDASGNILGTQRYYPYGETRLTTGTIFRDKLFTGQREMAGLGIYHYGARFYSPKLGRFLSADTIVPGYGNPQNLNRFSYVTNNPLRYTDPTGHMMTVDDGGGCFVCSHTTQPRYTPTRTHRPTPTPTPPCTSPTNNCATGIAGQATFIAGQSTMLASQCQNNLMTCMGPAGTATLTATPSRTPRPLSQVIATEFNNQLDQVDAFAPGIGQAVPPTCMINAKYGDPCAAIRAVDEAITGFLLGARVVRDIGNSLGSGSTNPYDGTPSATPSATLTVTATSTPSSIPSTPTPYIQTPTNSPTAPTPSPWLTPTPRY